MNEELENKRKELRNELLSLDRRAYKNDWFNKEETKKLLFINGQKNLQRKAKGFNKSKTILTKDTDYTTTMMIEFYNNDEIIGGWHYLMQYSSVCKKPDYISEYILDKIPYNKEELLYIKEQKRIKSEENKLKKKEIQEKKDKRVYSYNEVIDFGKYKNKMKWKDLKLYDPNYYNWLINNVDNINLIKMLKAEDSKEIVKSNFK